MPRVPVPTLSKEAQAALIFEILMYLENFQERIWSREGPSSAVGELLRAIAKGTHARDFKSAWLQQVLKKVPVLWEKIRPYYESVWS